MEAAKAMRYLLCLSLFLSLAAKAQVNTLENWYILAKPKAGFLAAHRSTMAHLPKEHVLGGEISVYKRFSDIGPWQKAYRNPYAGLTLYGSTVGNNAILGQAFGAYGFIDFPIAESPKHSISFKLSTGLGYITKVFDQEANPKNVAMSTHVNALVCVGFQGRVRLAEKHELIYGIDLTHLSNGSSKVPNLGLNMPNLSLGYAYRFRQVARQPDSSAVYSAVTKPRFFENWKLGLLGIVSEKEVFPTGGRHYPVFALSISERKIFRPKLGAELTFDVVSKQALVAYKPFIDKSQWQMVQMGIFAGYVLPLERFHFVFGMGVYVKDRYRPDNIVYHRVGMRYQFDNGLMANLTLKAHFAKADYVEYGIGYTFKHRRRK
jgi:hypothetical protein